MTILPQLKPSQWEYDAFTLRNDRVIVVRLVRPSLLVAVALIVVFLLSSSTWRIQIKRIHLSQQPPSVSHGAPRHSKIAIVSTKTTAAKTDQPWSTEAQPQATAFSPATKHGQEVDIPSSTYAYVFYATNNLYACSALVNIHRLLNFRTRHHIHLLAAPGVSDRYIEAFQALNITVTVLDPPALPGNSSQDYYNGCLLKLLAFRMHKIDPNLRRIIVLDGDQLILRSLDSLFELPSVDIAAPRAYWIAKDAFASTMMVIEPSERVWKRVSHGIESLKPGEYDMDLVNLLFGDTVLLLPGSYVTLNSHWEDWNLPRWFRPERTDVDKAGPKAQKLAEMKALWRALNHLSGRPDEDGTLLPESMRNQKRKVDDLAEDDSEMRIKALTESTGTDQQEPRSTRETTEAMRESHPPLETTLAFIHEGEVTEQARVTDPDLIALNHDLLVQPLHQLYRSAYVLHFTAVGKPWSWSLDDLNYQYPNAHPALYDQFEMWRTQALQVCPLSKDDTNKETIAE